jgi:hypothetical protein
VVSDLSLSPATNAQSRPVTELIDLLGDIDDAAVVIVAGNLFHPDATSDLAKFIDATFLALPALVDGVASFCAKDGHRFIVLPGGDDYELAHDERAQEKIEALGAVLAKDVILQVATADGVRDLGVVAGMSHVDAARADADDRADADRLEDPPSLSRFVSSRVLYRRLGAWVWLPVLAMLVFDLFNTLTKLISHFTHHHYKVHAPHTTSFWGNLLVNILIIVIFEAVVVGIAGLMVRRRFDRTSRESESPSLAEPLARTTVNDVDALEIARRIGERGGAGAVVGGAPRPALAFLDRGVCVTPGPSRTVVVERRGRFGLPPVFSSVDRIGYVEIEAASTVQVRLYVGQSTRRRGTLLERLVAGRALQPSPPSATTTVGSWPTGNPFPVTVERLAEQRRQRTVRRWAGGLLFLDGLVNVAVTVSPPLRSRLHAVLSILPLGVAQSAAALTALAGIGMIMMARGVRRGQRRAWFIAIGALGFTMITHLARAGSIVSSLIAAAILVLLIVERRYFQATTDRSSLATALPRLGLIAGLSLAAATIGIEASSGRHHLPSFGVVVFACIERLIGQNNIALPDRAGDFVDPTLLTIGVALIVSLCYLLTRPV